VRGLLLHRGNVSSQSTGTRRARRGGPRWRRPIPGGPGQTGLRPRRNDERYVHCRKYWGIAFIPVPRLSGTTRAWTKFGRRQPRFALVFSVAQVAQCEVRMRIRLLIALAAALSLVLCEAQFARAGQKDPGNPCSGVPTESRII
jgi:hypothetical protein